MPNLENIIIDENGSPIPLGKIATMGNPNLCTLDRVNKIIACLRNGNTRVVAAKWTGITDACLSQWVNHGLPINAEISHKDFLQRVNIAESEAEMEMVSALRKAANGFTVRKSMTKSRTIFKNRVEVMPNGVRVIEPIALQEITKEESEETVFDYRAAVEYLKRRKPDSWSDRNKIELTGPDGGPLQIDAAARIEASKELEQWRNEQNTNLLTILVPPEE